MSIDPHAIWSERFEQIGALIEQNAEALTLRWSERALEEQSDAHPAHRDEMRNGLPEFLRVLGRGLAKADQAAPRPHAMIALAHGEQRWRIGWQLAEVIRDYQILRLAILENLDACLESSLSTRESMAIGLALDEAISASVMAYVGHQEGQLREANARLCEFLPVLGHELRNPLSAVVGAMEVISLCKVQDAVVREAHEIITRQVSQITRLVDDMLDVARIMRGQLDVRAELVDAAMVIRETVDVHRPMFAERGQILEVSLPAEPLWVQADAGRLRQVLSNLFSNAMKYTEAKGRIFVEATRKGRRIVIRVRDTGQGIPKELLPVIFDMFAQAPQHKRQGLGIGLALVRALVQIHGGTIDAISAGPGKGSEFVIKLPAATEGLEGQAEGSSAAIPERRPAGFVACYRILLIDDHRDSAQTLAMLLERNGHEVRVAHDGRSALSMVANYVPDVILIDIGLPEMDGYEVVRALRQREAFARTPVIAITGYATDADREIAKLAGFSDRLVKPVDWESLQAALSRLRKDPQ